MMMKTTACALLCVLAGAAGAQAQVVLGVPDSSAPWLGYMNWFELPANGGGFAGGSPWGVPDLRAQFSPTVLTLLPNSIGDPSPFWYTPSSSGPIGNKIMEANLYIESTGGALNGQNVSFQGTILSNTFTSAHQVFVFIKDFAPDFSSVVQTLVPVSSAGAFSVSLNTINDPNRKVQYGFQVVGENVWISRAPAFGSMTIAIPTPGAAALIGLGGLVAMRRRR
jgi:hypothetical protein